MEGGGGIDIQGVFSAHEADLARVEEHLHGTFSTDVALLSMIGRHILRSGGKRIRPLFLIKSARLAGYEGEDHFALAAVIETIHTASLLHDDVVDGAEVRRGRPAAHSLWGGGVVVLAGDYLYSYALKLAVGFRSLPIMEALSTAVSMMAKGELLQLQKAGDLEVTEEDYIRIVTGKTGILFSSACRIGAILGGATAEREEALAAYGLNVGILFQVADDILDYHARESEFGKRLGTDLAEGKITLPLIYLLQSASPEERREIGLLLEREGHEEGELRMIVGLMDRYEVGRRVFRRAEELVEAARRAIDVFPPSREREELAAMAEYALVRGR